MSNPIALPDEPPERVGNRLFGGKSPKALPWTPLPLMQDYLDNLEIDERVSEYVRPVRVGLSHFATFAAGEGIRHPDEITRTHILHFQAYLQKAKKDNGKPLSLAYRQQLLKYVRGWVNWMLEIEHITTNPWVRIKIGTVAKKPKPLEEDEVAALFAAHRAQAFSIPPFQFHRREIILVLLYGWGLRIHELQALNVAGMDARLEYVTVRNKGGGTKPLPYDTAMKAVVQRWLGIRASCGQYGEDALVIDQYGKRLSIAMIRKIIVELGKRAGIAINQHRLRDTYGTLLLDNDVPLEQIMVLLGHSTEAQVLAYSRVNNHKVKESHTRVMNPQLGRLLSQPPRNEE
jgi:site-specific recombinase XerD